MCIHCNTGVRSTNLVSTLPEDHMTNNHDDQGAFMVMKPDAKQFLFVESPEGLHYLDKMAAKEANNNGTMMAMNTVSENKANYMQNDY